MTPIKHSQALWADCSRKGLTWQRSDFLLAVASQEEGSLLIKVVVGSFHNKMFGTWIVFGTSDIQVIFFKLKIVGSFEQFS